MKHIPAQVVNFLLTQGFVVVSSIDKNGFPHTSCKGIVKVDPAGKIYLVDVYHGVTRGNIAGNPRISISLVDEHKFSGYCLKGMARMVENEAISQEIIKTWEDNLTGRLTKRLLKNLALDKGQRHHPEAHLPPLPKHLIVLEVEEIVDLAPEHLNKEV